MGGKLGIGKENKTIAALRKSSVHTFGTTCKGSAAVSASFFRPLLRPAGRGQGRCLASELPVLGRASRGFALWEGEHLPIVLELGMRSHSLYEQLLHTEIPSVLPQPGSRRFLAKAFLEVPETGFPGVSITTLTHPSPNCFSWNRTLMGVGIVEPWAAAVQCRSLQRIREESHGGKGCLWASSWVLGHFSSQLTLAQGARTEPRSKLTGPWRERGWIL